MKIIYQGTDITGLAGVKKCIVRDTAGKRCDSLEIAFDNAEMWHAWGPEKDDRIIVRHDGYDSGTMYVNTVLPEDGTYRIIATALPCAARAKGFRSFRLKTVEEIMRICAMASSMDYRIFGIDGKAAIPYTEQDDESPAAFLSRLLALEGAALKCVSGRYTAIGYEYAQDLEPVQTIPLPSAKPGALYCLTGTTLRELRVCSPYASVAVTDRAVSQSHGSTVISLPVTSSVQAWKWARWKLYEYNRECECVHIRSDFNPFMTAMARVDIESVTETSGEWIVETAEHDFVEKKTIATLRRCIRSIR